MMTAYKNIVIVLLAAGALTLSAEARVFWVRPAARGHAALAATRGWQTVYTSSVRINEGRGSLAVMSCSEPLGSVMAGLRQAYASGAMLENFRQNETLGWARLREDNAVVSLLALAPNAPEQTVLFVLTQTQDDFDKSRLTPSAPRLRDPPPYPNSRVQTFLTSEESRLQLEIYAAPAAPEAVRQYYAGALLGRDWTRLDAAGASASLAIYRKGAALCALLVLPAGNGLESTITVLHKRLKME